MASTGYQKQRIRQMKRFWKWFIIIVIAFLFLSAFGKYIWGLIGFNIVYSEGERVGQVIKLSNKGLIWKTWEGTLVITQTGGYGQYWDFSIDAKNQNKEKLVNDLYNAYNTGDIVKIHYIQRYGALPWHGETSYLIQKVEFVGVNPYRR